MHYPTDVLAGWIPGFAVIGVFSLLDRYIQKEWQYYLILFVSGIPGLFFVRTNDYFTALGCLIGAFLVYLIANTLLKLPFDKQFLAGASLGAFFIRMARYAIAIFMVMGVYPMAFPLFERAGKNQ